MTINELYQKVGGDYNGVLKRIPAPALIVKYLLRFVECEDYPKCLKAFADADYELAFRSAHNIKGMALNLGLNRVAASAGALCEPVRHGAPTTDVTPLLDAMKKDFEETAEQIRLFQASN